METTCGRARWAEDVCAFFPSFVLGPQSSGDDGEGRAGAWKCCGLGIGPAELALFIGLAAGKTLPEKRQSHKPGPKRSSDHNWPGLALESCRPVLARPFITPAKTTRRQAGQPSQRWVDGLTSPSPRGRALMASSTPQHGTSSCPPA